MGWGGVGWGGVRTKCCLMSLGRQCESEVWGVRRCRIGFEEPCFMANGEKEGGIVGMSSRMGLIFFTSGTKGDFLSNVPRGQ